MPEICLRYAWDMPKICPRYAQDIPTIIGGTLLVFGGTLLTYGGILSVFGGILSVSGGILSVSGGMFLLGEHYHFYIDRVGARFYWGQLSLFGGMIISNINITIYWNWNQSPTVILWNINTNWFACMTPLNCIWNSPHLSACSRPTVPAQLLSTGRPVPNWSCRDAPRWRQFVPRESRPLSPTTLRTLRSDLRPASASAPPPTTWGRLSPGAYARGRW